MLFYYITDRIQFPGSETERRESVLRKVAEATRCGVDFIQLREKDLPVRDLEKLAFETVRVIRENSPLISNSRARQTKLLINSRTDVAISCGADGVHLQSTDVRPRDVLEVWTKATHDEGLDIPQQPSVIVSCHTLSDVVRTEENGANFAVLGPVLEKKSAPEILPTGLNLLREACERKIPVLALGGINLANAHLCIEAGAAGIAAIRLFQENNIADVMCKLHERKV
ncbi:MAG TPA: thiamine phosphate synthase [Terriglobales bacterium]|nr:thiamine phosphate synthase [Terriglobales bacterium]